MSGNAIKAKHLAASFFAALGKEIVCVYLFTAIMA